VYVAEDGYSLEDLGSTNGTWLNGTLTLKHVPYKLHSGDQIRLGTLTLYVYFDSNHVAG
jgi:pSer/pThr/pTyr-binding forkhead associated (FHA) protein